MSTDAERRELYDALVTNLGPGPAGTLMAGLLFPADRAELARQSDLLALRHEFTELRGEFTGLRGEVADLRGEFRELRAEVRGELAEVRGELAEVRSDVRSLGIRLDAQLSKLVAANAVTAVAVAGLAFAAARLAG